eukprot:3362921-Pyramimonas_sp.AAC.1
MMNQSDAGVEPPRAQAAQYGVTRRPPAELGPGRSPLLRGRMWSLPFRNALGRVLWETGRTSPEHLLLLVGREPAPPHVLPDVRGRRCLRRRRLLRRTERRCGRGCRHRHGIPGAERR